MKTSRERRDMETQWFKTVGYGVHVLFLNAITVTAARKQVEKLRTQSRVIICTII